MEALNLAKKGASLEEIVKRANFYHHIWSIYLQLMT